MNVKGKKFYQLGVEEVIKKLGTDRKGLSRKEANERYKKYGPNVIESKEGKSLLALLFDQINNPIIYLLTAAVVVSFLFGDIPEAIAILIVIILNTAIGFWMEYQAQSSIHALKKLDRLKAQVIRDDNIQEIFADKVVPGDIIDLDAGDIIPADARLIYSKELSIDESPLTGESLPVDKNTKKLDGEVELADRKNMVFKGTAVTGGKATGVVIATGKETEIGAISEMVSGEEKEKIPINRKLQKLSHRLIWFTLGLAAIFFVIGWLTGKELYLLLQTSIAWAVAAIPEGLPIVASIALARGMLRLSRKNVLVKKLAAVETLGETTVIFTDKTGTLTENKLSLSGIEYPGREIEFSGISEDKNKKKKLRQYENEKNLEHVFLISGFCNDAEKNNGKDYDGDPLDISLMKFLQTWNHDLQEDLYKNEPVHEDPFDSDSKFMGTVNLFKDELYIAAKGAAEPILSRSMFYLKDGDKKKLDEEFRKHWLRKNDELSARGLKVIATSYRTEEKSKQEEIANQDDFVNEMIFTGFITFIDPAKTDVKEAIEKCHHAGIEVIMVTGDHPGTAKNIAEKVSLRPAGDISVMRGRDIERKEDEVHDTNLFARVDPEQKYEIVEHFQRNGEITAMTGDGVNDAPALKKADIGIAMGKRGTQIAQDVADMILKDDSFPSIVNAIQEGRIIFGNIRKFIIYQLSYHFAEILIIAGISFSLFKIPLLPLQLLFLNLLSDVFPALALGLGKGDKNIMHSPPKDPAQPIINKRNWITMGIYGIIMAVTITGAYLLSVYQFDLGFEKAGTIAFFSLALSQLLHVFNMRDADEKFFRNQVTQNRYIWMAIGICLFALSASYFIPLLRDVLSFEILNQTGWLIVAISSLLTLGIIQVIKSIFRI